jgi:hypothetical protein
LKFSTGILVFSSSPPLVVIKTPQRLPHWASNSSDSNGKKKKQISELWLTLAALRAEEFIDPEMQRCPINLNIYLISITATSRWLTLKPGKCCIPNS